MKSSAKKVELAPYDDLFSTEESRQDAKLEKIQEIPLSELHPFKGHPFKVKDDEAMMETPVMQSDIMLQSGEKVLIIDAKYYEHSTQVQFDKHTLHSGNLYQIFTYVKNKEYELREKNHTVSGMLLYAKTDEEIYPNNVYQMSGNQITVRTLDLNLPFDEIAGQLNTIAKTHFDL